VIFAGKFMYDYLNTSTLSIIYHQMKVFSGLMFHQCREGSFLFFGIINKDDFTVSDNALNEYEYWQAVSPVMSRCSQSISKHTSLFSSVL